MAETEVGVLGYAWATRTEERGSDFLWARRGVHIPCVVVHPNARLNGVGRALFSAIEAWAEAFGAEYVGLNVNARNEAAKDFYAKLGYHPESEYRAKALRKVVRLKAQH